MSFGFTMLAVQSPTVVEPVLSPIQLLAVEIANGALSPWSY